MATNPFHFRWIEIGSNHSDLSFAMRGKIGLKEYKLYGNSPFRGNAHLGAIRRIFKMALG